MKRHYMNRQEIDEKIKRNKEKKHKIDFDVIKGFSYFAVFLFIILFILYQFVSCVSCSGPSSSYTHDETDTSYWNSVNRENQLRESGNEGAANMEENARHEYNHGGGYHDQNGNRQVGFKGSREQKQQLEEMDRRGW